MDDLNLFRVRTLDETTSTNDEVKRALEAGEPEGLVVRARRQVAGYGRQGRAWTSPEGGLYCSLLLRPAVEPAVLPTLSLVVGIAVRRAVVALAGEAAAVTVQIKWPNDVVVVQNASGAASPDEDAALPGATAPAYMGGPASAGAPADAPASAGTPSDAPTSAGILPGGPAFAKLCGISCEAHGGGVCVGVGVNVLPPAERAAVGGKNRAAYAVDVAGSTAGAVLVEAVLDAFLDAFGPLYREWTERGIVPFLGEYNACASLTGRFVQVVNRAGEPLGQGAVARVDEGGSLVLRDDAGAETRVFSGEAHIVC